ncbi:MAG TPA: hypothetical protein VMH83_07665, partial [Candidatus Acidoferrum sp.]|nr:hypothetical protein [Candidatus Acidoferrum sp.]
MMTFDPTITIGNAIEICAFIFGGLMVIFRLGGDIRIVKVDMAHLKTTVAALTNAFDKLGTVLTQVAVQDSRLIALEKRLDELAHGHGWVINGEFPHK